jgi:putative transposase
LLYYILATSTQGINVRTRIDMSILTYKLKHGRDFSEELSKAVKVAQYSIKHKNCRTTKSVKHIGLKACIANQILRKYGNNRKAKDAKSVKLTINGYFIKVDREKKTITIPSIKLELPYQFPNNFTKINQVEVDNKFAYISVTVADEKQRKVKEYLGIDRNTTGHCCVAAIAKTGKVWKLGKKSQHTHVKYSKMRKKLQAQGKKQKLKQIKRREANVVKDLNHKISRKIVEIAKKNGVGIKMEDLKQIRETSKQSRSFKYSLNSWGFYQLQQMIEYKSRLLGIPVVYVASPYTSKTCSRCGLIGRRSGKTFTCSCGHVDHADSNAAFNISVWEAMAGESFANSMKRGRSVADRDVIEGSTDTPQMERSKLNLAKDLVLV